MTHTETPATLLDTLKGLSHQSKCGNKTYQLLSYNNEVKLAHEIYVHSRKRAVNPLQMVQLFALRNGVIPMRYLDNIVHMGIENQIKLLESRVAIVGIGRLGSQIVENLSRLGVGNILLIDNSEINDKNLNSQSIALPEHLAIDKTTIMALRVRDINSAVNTQEINVTVDCHNIEELLSGCDYIVSTSSSLQTHQLLSSYAKKKRKTFIFGSIDGFNGSVFSITPDDEKTFEELFALNGDDYENAAERTTMSHVSGIVAGYQTSEIVHLIATGKSKIQERVHRIEVENFNNYLTS